MYKQRDDIERLIASLTSGEKRYFTTHYRAGLPEDDLPLYLALYDLHENGKSQSSKKIEEAGGRAITAAKRRLYDNIVDSIVALNQEYSVSTQVQHLLSAIELLLSKGLSSQALLLWRKAYEACTGQEKFGLLLQVLDWEKRLNIVLDNPTRSSEEIKDEEDSTLEKMKQILALERIYSHIMLLKRQYGYVKGTLREKLEKETIRSIELPAEKDCLSEKASYYFNLIHAIYYWMIKEHRKGYASSKKLIIGSGANILPNDYINGIFQHITSSVCLGNFNDTLNGIALAESFLRENHLDQSVAFRIQLFAYKATYSLVTYNYMGDRRKLVQAIVDTEEKLRQFSGVLPLELRQIIIGNLMNAYAGIGNFTKADLLWLDMNDKQYRGFRQDVHADLYLFRLFSLLHSKSYALIPSAALSAQRFFKKTVKDTGMWQTELAIAQYLLKERNYSNGAVLKSTMEQIQQYIEQIIGEYPSRYQEHYTRYLIWCQAILNDELYHKAAKRWYLGFSQARKTMY